MRTIAIAIFLFVFAFVSIPLYLVEAIIGLFHPRLKFQLAQAIVVKALKLVLFLSGTKISVKGTEHVPKNEAVLYIANHRSYFDIVIGYATVPTLTSFVAKKEMEHLPLVSHWMRILKCLFLDRTDIRAGMKTILTGIAQIKEGYSIFIMPEGTRNHDKEMLPFREGSFKFAEKSGCAIIPVSMNHTDEIFENHIPWVKKTHVCIEYGKPIYLKDLSQEDRKFVGAYVQNIIKETLEKNEQSMLQ